MSHEARVCGGHWQRREINKSYGINSILYIYSCPLYNLKAIKLDADALDNAYGTAPAAHHDNSGIGNGITYRPIEKTCAQNDGSRFIAFLIDLSI